MHRKILSAIISFCAAAAFSLTAFSACQKQTNDSDEQNLQAGDDVRVLDGIELDYDNAFFDDFTNGVDYDTWYIGKQSWGSGGNGGVIPENVNYTDEGVLVLSGNGEYYTAGDVKGVGERKDGTLTGGAITSKFITGPGRYQVKMKVLPRQGACSAFWTYCYQSETGGNHEIDIELPGGKSSGMISFENVLNTNYITVSNNQSQDVNVQTTTGEAVALNDGEWHTFGFDWYTQESGEQASLNGEDTSAGKVVYYIDGKVTAISDLFVPYVAARLWLGVWFPNNASFVGTANFESDCMYVDWVSYTPFKDQPYTDYVPALSSNQVAGKNEYPSTPVSTTVVNKVANGDFEFAVGTDVNSGWESYLRRLTTNEKAALRSVYLEQYPEMTDKEITKAINSLTADDPSKYCTIAEDIGYRSSCGLKVEGIGGYMQVIDSIYNGFNIEFSCKAKGRGTVTIGFYGNGDGEPIEEIVIDVDSQTWQEFSKKYTAPEGTKKVYIDLYTVLDGEMFADDISFKVV